MDRGMGKLIVKEGDKGDTGMRLGRQSYGACWRLIKVAQEGLLAFKGELDLDHETKVEGNHARHIAIRDTILLILFVQVNNIVFRDQRGKGRALNMIVYWQVLNISFLFSPSLHATFRTHYFFFKEGYDSTETEDHTCNIILLLLSLPLSCSPAPTQVNAT
ncbi:uncharacterized protein LY79DRAFT_82592 [Colletotrichum navitas]|uniref:Uncharacterized protein n=1 Tax=Colletotrichum navitas TaxID=681940 RepID=A0AAD8V8W9_9PEZI|nr:uncharacterized protein LY79DRAFT_82592 [Colletotrichum navitas]KAK1596166.1 hypothetical protein LY79DRAFT_82592 [Colletotrichum navitas]